MIRSQRFYHFLFSYILLVVLLLVAVSGVVHRNFFDTLRGEVEESTVASLAQFRDAVDLRMLEMNRLASQLSANPLLTPYAAADGGYGPLQAVAELKQYLSTNLFIEDVVLYYKSSGVPKLYAASGTYDADLFFDSIYRYRDWSKADFLSTAGTLTAPLMRPVEPVTFNRVAEQRYATYMAPIPLNAEMPYGVALFLIREEALAGVARGVLTETDGFLFVMNGRGEVVFRQANGVRERTGERLLEAIRGMPGQSGAGKATADGRDYSLLKLRSDVRDWSYAVALPSDQWMSKVDDTRSIFNTTVAAVFLIGVAVAILFSIRHYRPLHRLAGIVKERHRSESLGDTRDEFDFISRAVGQMAEEKESLLHRLRSQSRALSEQVLGSLIKGKWKTRQEIDDMLQFSNLRLDLPHYAVMLLMIDDYATFRRQNSGHMQELLTYGLIKAVEELSAEAGSGFGVELIDGRSIVFLVNLNEGFDDPDVLRELAEKARAFFKQYFRLTVTIGLGGIYDDIASIPRSYMEASHAARHRFVKGCDQVFAFPDIAPRSAGQYAYPVDRIDQLVKAIKQGDGRQLESAVRGSFGHIVESDVSVEAAECICFDIVNSIMKTLIELEIEVDDRLGETLQQLFVPRCETIEELEHLVIGICLNVCKYVESQKESKNVLLLEAMKAYVDQHYREHSLDLESIAGRFGLSPSYATRFFKNQTGCSLMRHIDSKRMEEAKRLLKTTEMTLREIMTEVGYVDSTNFIRKFKKAEGVTPIQYRNLARNGTA
ncbi:helix-turn-helix domain-containing protein [Paenibacillus flagellatus]|uniref:helix-turn-helix domain-containing protein n=1 Tax=Paenibacillus flagellatus TaxID=2211139 RepID=UPI0013050D9B|nr:helix-turn-helix domain-containing protein [Paenibacillus flagellatus]